MLFMKIRSYHPDGKIKSKFKKTTTRVQRERASAFMRGPGRWKCM
jgi:hypothetical protein